MSPVRYASAARPCAVCSTVCGVTFQRTKTWKESGDPDFSAGATTSLREEAKRQDERSFFPMFHPGMGV
jgi:hypothetical protein